MYAYLIKWHGHEACKTCLLYVLFAFLAFFRACTTFNSTPIILNLLTNRNIALIYSVTIFEQKTKDCARSASFHHKLQHR